jgi:hypothetical protein
MRTVALVERLREPDSHDPSCPFLHHCYCDGAPHDNVQDDDKLEAAALIEELVEALEWMEAFARIRSEDESKVFARVGRNALRTITGRCEAALSKAHHTGG